MTFPFSLLPLGGLIKIHYPEVKANIESFIFKINYKFSTTLCLLLAFLSSEFFGPAIQCNFLNDFTQEYINSFCWLSTNISKPGVYESNDYIFPMNIDILLSVTLLSNGNYLASASNLLFHK